MGRKRSKAGTLVSRLSGLLACAVVVATIALPIAPGAGNSTGVLLASAVVALVFFSAPNRVGVMMLLIALCFAASSGALPPAWLALGGA